VRTLTPVSRQEATKLMASALQKQANVVFEALDEKRVSVKLAKK